MKAEEWVAWQSDAPTIEISETETETEKQPIPAEWLRCP
jgi:hypothetical protein